MSAPSSSPVLVGRDDELAAARAVLDAARAGQARVLVLGGDAGIGKSRLLGELLEGAAADGWTVMAGSCVDLGEGAPPFAPVADAVRRLRRTLGDERILDAICIDPGGLGTLLPGWAVGVEPGTPVTAGRVYEAVLELLDALAESGPVVFAIEDLHWADASTRDLVAFLTRNLGDVPVVVVATVRTDDLHRRHPLRPLLAELERHPRVERHDLGPLDEAAVEALLTHLAGRPPTPEALAAIVDRSEGNPFFAEELVLCDGDEGCAQLPASVRDGMLTRVTALPDGHQAVLRTAAAVGRNVPDPLLLELAARPRTELDGILRDLIEASLLVLDGDGYRFRHALLQEAVYDELLPAERVALHARIAEHLSGTGVSAAELARHWSEARRQPEAFEASVAAGLEAEARGAPSDAVAHYQRALELWDAVPDAPLRSPLDRMALLDRAAMAASNVGRYDQALALHRSALGMAEAAGDVHRAGWFQARIAKDLFLDNQPDDEEAYLRAVELVPAEPWTRERVFVLAGRAQVLMLTGRLGESIAVCEEALAGAVALGERQLEGELRNTLGTALANNVDERGFRELRQALAIAEEVGHAEDIGRAYVNLTSALAENGQWDELFAVGAEGIAETRRRGIDRTHGAYLQTNIIDGLVAVGRWDDAVAAQQSFALRLPDSIISFFGVDPLLSDRGAFEEAAAAIERTLDLPAQHTAVLQGTAAIYEARVAYAVWTGQLDAVPALVDEVLERLPEAMVSWKIAPILWRATWAAADQAARARARGLSAEVEVARALADRYLARLEEVAAWTPGSGRARPVVGSQALLALTRAERARLDEADTVDAWCDAAEAFDALGIVYPAAYARYRAADAAIRAGLVARRSPTVGLTAGARAPAHGDADGGPGVGPGAPPTEPGREATALVQQAATTARALGARPLLGLCEQLAARARIPLDPDRPSAGPAGPDDDGLGLSERERQVLALVAAGRTNRQIGAELFISPKTASVHVSNILAKLGVASRVEAAAVAHRLELVS
ncbi:MAG: helix-turn-helix transcriptional regulator [Acidimicrobiia bacterium]